MCPFCSYIVKQISVVCIAKTIEASFSVCLKLFCFNISDNSCNKSNAKNIAILSHWLQRLKKVALWKKKATFNKTRRNYKNIKLLSFRRRKSQILPIYAKKDLFIFWKICIQWLIMQLKEEIIPERETLRKWKCGSNLISVQNNNTLDWPIKST